MLGLVSKEELDRHSALVIKHVKKTRTCIRLNCGAVFVSRNSGHRLCGSCQSRNLRRGVLAEHIYENR